MASGGGKPQNLGIGLHLETKANGEQLVRDVKPGFDAEAKGLCAGTIIHTVGAVKVKGMDLRTVRELIVGPPGSICYLTVQFPGSKKVVTVECVRSSVGRGSVMKQPGVESAAKGLGEGSRDGSISTVSESLSTQAEIEERQRMLEAMETKEKTRIEREEREKKEAAARERAAAGAAARKEAEDKARKLLEEKKRKDQDEAERKRREREEAERKRREGEEAERKRKEAEKRRLEEERIAAERKKAEEQQQRRRREKEEKERKEREEREARERKEKEKRIQLEREALQREREQSEREAQERVRAAAMHMKMLEEREMERVKHEAEWQAQDQQRREDLHQQEMRVKKIEREQQVRMVDEQRAREVREGVETETKLLISSVSQQFAVDSNDSKTFDAAGHLAPAPVPPPRSPTLIEEGQLQGSMEEGIRVHTADEKETAILSPPEPKHESVPADTQQKQQQPQQQPQPQQQQQQQQQVDVPDDAQIERMVQQAVQQHLDATLSALHSEHAIRRQEIRSKLRGLSQSVEEALMHIRHHSESRTADQVKRQQLQGEVASLQGRIQVMLKLHQQEESGSPKKQEGGQGVARASTISSSPPSRGPGGRPPSRSGGATHSAIL